MQQEQMMRLQMQEEEEGYGEEEMDGAEMDDEESKEFEQFKCVVGYLILELGNDILRMLGVE
jgi:hypothetical protein